MTTALKQTTDVLDGEQVAVETRAPRERLFVDGKLRCPNDRQLRHVSAYLVLEIKPRYEQELNPVMQCPDCNHFFSPKPDA